MGADDIREDDIEFVASDARRCIRLSYICLESFGNLLEQFIAGFMTEGIVNFLEAVKIQEKQRNFAPVAARLKCRNLPYIGRVRTEE